VNWDAIGAGAELLGAIGVVLSLIYLAAQIRQSTHQTTLSIQAVSTNALQQIVSAAGTFNLEVARDPGLAELVVKATGGLHTLDAVERLRFWMLYGAAFENHQNAFTLHSQGFISDEHWLHVRTGRLTWSRGRVHIERTVG